MLDHSKPSLLTPISHLFNDPAARALIIDRSDYLEGRERTVALNLPNTTHFHIDFNLNHGLNEQQLEFLKDNLRDRNDLRVVTFQAATDCEHYTIKDGLCYPASNLLSFDQQIANATSSVRKIRDILGSEISIGIENNNYYSTGAFDICTSEAFLLHVIDKNDLHLLYDIAHAAVTCYNRKISLQSYQSQLMTAPCRQIHLCEPTIPVDGCGFATDTHNLPTNESLLSALALAKAYSIPFLTIEYYKDSNDLIMLLAKLKDYLNGE